MLTNAPLILAGEASEMYNGDVNDTIPTPIPMKILPSMRTPGFGAAAIKIAPRKNKKSAIRSSMEKDAGVG